MQTEQFTFVTDPATAPKLTNWAKEPTLQFLKGDLEAAKPSHTTHVQNMDRWQNLLSVTGDQKPPKRKGRSSVQPKLIRRQAEWRYSALSEPFLDSQKPFKIEPATFEDDLAAKQNALVLNWQFRTKLNRVKFIDDYVHSTVDEGTCVVRVGWERVTVPTKQKVPVYTFTQIETQEEADQFKQYLEHRHENIREFLEQAPPEVQEALKYFDETGEATTATAAGETEITTDKVLINQPTVEVMNPRNVYFDPSCQGDVSKALFAICSFETNKASLLKAGKRYKNLKLIDWEGTTTVQEPNHETNTPQDFRMNDPLRKKVVAYEYWGEFDIHDNGTLVPIVATWIGNVLIRMEENPYPDQKHPFVVVPYLPKKREIYGEPDAELLEDNQKVLGAVTRGAIDLMGRSANGQQGMAKGFLDPLNRKRFDNGEDYEFNPAMPPNVAVTDHKYPEMPRSALEMMQMQNADAESLSGVKAFSGGVSGDAYGDVAAGIRGALDASAKRESSILRRLAQGMQEIGNKIVAMNGEFLAEEEVIRVTNSDFVKVKREDLKGNFDLIVDISTTEIDERKAQDMGFMIQTIGPNAGPDITMMVLAEIADLKRMPALAQKLRTFKPQPDPVQEKLKELAVQKEQMEIALLQSQIQLNKANAQLGQSKSNKTDLDYIEQETGTKHERELQKQKAQSDGNQDLQVTKALLTPLKEKERKPDIVAAIGYNAVSDKLKVENGPTPGLLPNLSPVNQQIPQ